VRQDSDISTEGTEPVYVIDMSEEQINIKIVQTVEKFPVIYDYSSPGHSNKRRLAHMFYDFFLIHVINAGTYLNVISIRSSALIAFV
jgi:hypothetical protein